MKALIGVDGSEGGWDALQQAATLLFPDRGHITLYYAPPKIHFSGARAAPELAARTRENVAKAIFEQAIERIPTPLRPRVTTIVGEQGPRRGLILAAEQTQADFIAVGADGLGAMRLLLGSVTRAILRHSTRPVLVVRPVPVRQHRAAYRVLWALDEVPVVPAPIDFLQRLAWPQGASGSVIHVVDPLQALELPPWFAEKTAHDQEFSRRWSEELAADKQRKFNEMAAFTAELPRPFGDLPILLEGNVSKTVIEKATQEAADLVIVGTRDLGPVERFFLGSTAETILQYAPCSVLVVHMPPKP